MIGQEQCRNDTTIPPEVCESLLFLLCGPDVSELDPVSFKTHFIDQVT